MKQKETMKQTKQTTSENQFNQLHSKDFGLLGVVTNVKDAEGFLCLSDLCRILDLQKEKVQPGLDGHLYMVVVEGANGQQQKPFVDEEGLYLLFLISKIKDAVRFQDWLKSHLMGWWNNPNDRSTFMLQFNCQGSCYIYENIRMNVYLTKQEDDNTEVYDMTIKFLDLDDDNLEMMSYDTWIPEYAVTDNAILDYILEEMTLDGDFLEPENVDVLVILNSIVSFHRSRRL